ncbi:MAG: AAA family ATPase [Cyanobium sp.]
MASISSKGQRPPGSAVPSPCAAEPHSRSKPAARRNAPPRFHLLIGAAASGKSSAARVLARLLQQGDQRPVRLISSAAIRQELHGDPRVLGRWAEVEGEIQRQLCQALAAGETVILEACYVKRAFRLAITQGLLLPRAVQWVGWWLDTPLAQCLRWNQQRSDPVPEAVIHKHCAQLLQAGPVPHRQEGFAVVVRLQTGQGVPLEALIRRELAELERRIRHGANRDAAHQLHGYSRLLDQERLLYLLNLLSRNPKLTATSADRPAACSPPIEGLEEPLAPLPPGGLAERAAALLGRLHGACYGDPLAVAMDLIWLEREGFLAPLERRAAALPPPRAPVEPPPWPAGRPGPVGGVARLADREVFSQVFTLLRHLLHHPFDIASASDRGVGVCEHLARTLNALQRPGSSATLARWTWRQVHTAITDTLTPYGFRLAGSSGRHGYALGTALLSLEQLVATEGLLRLQAQHLGDEQAAALRRTLAERLQWSGIDLDGQPPLRRWLPAPPSAGSASPSTLALGETAIRQRQRLLISRRRSAPLAVWPLQLVLQEGRWWVLIEHDAIGQRAALLEALPLDELHAFPVEQRPGRSLASHRDALERWEVLLRYGGSLQSGGELGAQLALCQAAEPRAVAAGWERLRLRCSPAVMAALRRELERYPAHCLQLSRPLPGDSWGRREPRAVLPVVDDARHPYRLEVSLPPWVLADDPALRRWLFSYGAAIRLEGPEALVAEHRRWLKEALAAQRPCPVEERGSLPVSSGEDPATATDHPSSPRRRRKQRQPHADRPAHPCPLCGGPMVPLAPVEG